MRNKHVVALLVCGTALVIRKGENILLTSRGSDGRREKNREQTEDRNWQKT
jgi:hypothetical protein